MDRSNYLIPANTKSGGLILNIFTPTDLIMFLVGIGITLILLFVLPLDTLVLTIVALAPGLITSFLVLPIPNYHNIITLIKEIIGFFFERRNFIWKGWCVYELVESEKKKV